MIMKLCMEQYVLKLYKAYINVDPVLTLTQFKTMSNLAKLVRPRYQVSVYRTISTLVFSSFGLLSGHLLGNSCSLG